MFRRYYYTRTSPQGCLLLLALIPLMLFIGVLSILPPAAWLGLLMLAVMLAVIITPFFVLAHVIRTRSARRSSRPSNPTTSTTQARYSNRR